MSIIEHVGATSLILVKTPPPRRFDVTAVTKNRFPPSRCEEAAPGQV